MISLLAINLVFSMLNPAIPVQQTSKIHILIVTGQKDFDEKEFYKIFEANEDIVFDTATKPSVFEKFNSDDIDRYDVIVFYDGYRSTSEYEKESFMNLFEKGENCLFLHHSLISHSDWDEYKNIIGGKYHYNPWTEEGKVYGPSTYKHDQDFTVKIIDKNHAVTQGLSDFQIHDETYINTEIIDEVHPLLTTDDGESMKYVGWTHKRLNSDIVYIQLGHDDKAYQNENFRKLIYNSLMWLKKDSDL